MINQQHLAVMITTIVVLSLTQTLLLVLLLWEQRATRKELQLLNSQQYLRRLLTDPCKQEERK